MRWIERVLFYAGVKQEIFESVEDTMAEDNRKNLTVFSLAAGVALLLMIAASFMDDSLAKNRALYIVCAAACITISVLSVFVAKKHRGLIYPLVYVLTMMFMLFGIALGTYIEPNETTVSYVVLIFVIPLLFTDRPIRMNIAILTSILMYFWAAFKTQSPLMLEYNTTNVVPYGCLSIVVSSYMMRIKVERMALEKRNQFLSEADQLTGLENRLSFEKKLHEIKYNSKSENIVLCMMDLNGLKKVNDTLGHHAGDELLRAAADCIKNTFEDYGNVYRIGGDEFVAILEGMMPEKEKLLSDLKERTAQWQGENGEKLSVSAGMVHVENTMQIENALQKADECMYEAKKNYYKTAGLNAKNTASVED